MEAAEINREAVQGISSRPAAGLRYRTEILKQVEGNRRGNINHDAIVASDPQRCAEIITRGRRAGRRYQQQFAAGHICPGEIPDDVARADVDGPYDSIGFVINRQADAE